MESNFEKIKDEIINKYKFDITSQEETYIKKWVNEYKYNLDVIEFAFSKTQNKKNPNFEYLNCIITDWYKRDLRNLKDINNFINTMKYEIKK